LGMVATDVNWGKSEGLFEVLEGFFNTVYMGELILRILTLRRHFFLHVPNILDALIVVLSWLDFFVFAQLNFRVNVSVLRLVRLTRVFRVAKFLRASTHFSEMRVLLRTLRSGMRGILWSALLLLFLVVMGGIIMVQFSLPCLSDQNINLERRIWMYEAFGTTTRSIYTMFECTFTGRWGIYARPLIEEVGHHFTFFWLWWIVLVNFMTMRIIGALFLKQTMEVASIDAEKLAMENMKRRDKFAASLREIFEAADTSGDGSINCAEFDKMLRDETVIKHFESLDLDVEEVTALFSVLSSDDGDADYEEFLAGALKMNSSARTIDSVQVMHNQLKMAQSINRILEYMPSVECSPKFMNTHAKFMEAPTSP